LPCACRKPDLYYTPNEFNSAVLDRCPTVQSTYQCTPFLTNGHAETILIAKLRKPPGVVYKREILVTKDGGAVAVDWEHVDDDGKVSSQMEAGRLTAAAALAKTGPRKMLRATCVTWLK
jgi:predicted alpha/beta-fold hydrolase